MVSVEFVVSAAAPKTTYGEEDTQAHRSVGIGAGRARLPGVRVWRVSVVRVEAVVLWALPRWGAGAGVWDEAWAGMARLRGIHLSGLARISLAHIGRHTAGTSPIADSASAPSTASDRVPHFIGMSSQPHLTTKGRRTPCRRRLYQRQHEL